MDLASLLTSLSRPESFPGNPKSVEIVQTHISVVCLVDDWVYKLKKPVCFPFLDFSTLEKRMYFCEEELRLNRRLCPDIYRDVVALYQDRNERVSFIESEGATIVDYAVLMSRLPDHLLMSDLLGIDAVTEDQIKSLAGIVSGFHQRSASTEVIKQLGSPGNQCQAILGNFSQSYLPRIFTPALFQVVKDRVESQLDHLVDWLEIRSEQGRIVEGHGDLHTGNIFLTDPPTVFDCIEFNPEFRCGDVAVENALLMMDLTYSGHSDLAQIYIDSYGDTAQMEQMPMLLAYQAMVRAKVAALSVGDELLSEEKREENRISANRHLQLAAASLLMGQNLILQVCGLPGGGKSYLCEELTHRFGWPHLSSDSIRKQLAGYPLDDELPETYYTPDFSRQTYDELRTRCEAMMGSHPVLADANFGTEESRNRFSQIPHSKSLIIWIDCEEAVVMKRLVQRADKDSFGSDAGVEVYQLLKQAFEPPGPSDVVPVFRIDGEPGLETKIDQLLIWLLEN